MNRTARIAAGLAAAGLLALSGAARADTDMTVETRQKVETRGRSTKREAEVKTRLNPSGPANGTTEDVKVSTEAKTDLAGDTTVTEKRKVKVDAPGLKHDRRYTEKRTVTTDRQGRRMSHGKGTTNKPFQTDVEKADVKGDEVK